MDCEVDWNKNRRGSWEPADRRVYSLGGDFNNGIHGSNVREESIYHEGCNWLLFARKIEIGDTLLHGRPGWNQTPYARSNNPARRNGNVCSMMPLTCLVAPPLIWGSGGWSVAIKDFRV